MQFGYFSNSLQTKAIKKRISKDERQTAIKVIDNLIIESFKLTICLEADDLPPRYSHLVRVYVISPDFISQANLKSREPPPFYDELIKGIVIPVPVNVGKEKLSTDIIV